MLEPDMPCDRIYKGLEAAIQEEVFLIFYLTKNDDYTFLENILCIIRGPAVCYDKVMNCRIIVFIDILQHAVITGFYPLYDFLNRKFTHFIACSGVLRHKTKKKTLTAWRSKDIFNLMGRRVK